MPRRSAKTVGVVADTLAKTLMSPLFSATKTRPSAANWKAVGWTSPPKTSASWKPGWVVNDHTTGGLSGLPARSAAALSVAVYVFPACRSTTGLRVTVRAAAL